MTSTSGENDVKAGIKNIDGRAVGEEDTTALSDSDTEETPRLNSLQVEDIAREEQEDVQEEDSRSANGITFDGYGRVKPVNTEDATNLPVRPGPRPLASPAESTSTPDDTPSVQVSYLAALIQKEMLKIAGIDTVFAWRQSTSIAIVCSQT